MMAASTCTCKSTLKGIDACSICDKVVHADTKIENFPHHINGMILLVCTYLILREYSMYIGTMYSTYGTVS